MAWLTEALTSWSDLNSASQSSRAAESLAATGLGNFQEIEFVNRHSSPNHWGPVPTVVVDIHDRTPLQTSGSIARQPFHDRASGIFRENFGALSEFWLQDATLRETYNVLNSYRIVIPDGRGVLGIERLERGRLTLAVNGSSSGPLTLATVITSARGQVDRQTAPVKPGDLQEITLPPGPRMLEATLLDEGSRWLDRVGLWEQQLRPISEGGALQEQLSAPRYQAVREHYQKALGFASQEEPDLANAAKEAISAVESASKIISGLPRARLAKALEQLSHQNRLHPALAKAIESVWGFTNAKPGVRHGGVVPPRIDQRDAQFVLDVATAAIVLLLDLDQLPSRGS